MSQLDADYNFDEYNLSDSQLNDYLKDMTNQNQPVEDGLSQNELQNLIEHTLQLEYDIFLSEEELKFYKNVLAEKEGEIKRLKEKYNKKSFKATNVIDNIKKLQKKIRQIHEGYKKISIKKEEYSLDETTQRNERLGYQEKKSNLYRKCCELENNLSNVMLEIEQYNEVEAQYNQIRRENNIMLKEIEQFQNRKKEVTKGETFSKKEQLKAELKKMIEKLKIIEKQDEQISYEYESNRKALTQLQRQQMTINTKNTQIDSLYGRIDKLKEQIKIRRWEKQQREKDYHQLLSQESEMKKQISTQMEYRENQRKIKQNLIHNFKIIDSEADEDLSKLSGGFKSMSQHQVVSMQSNEQFDDLINRFQKIKAKPKNGAT